MFGSMCPPKGPLILLVEICYHSFTLLICSNNNIFEIIAPSDAIVERNFWNDKDLAYEKLLVEQSISFLDLMTQFDKTTMCLLYLCTALIISSGVIAAPTGPHNEDEVTCLSKNDTTGKSTKLFIFDDDTWPCQTNDGANNCLNFPMLQRAKESCMNKCCKEGTLIISNQI